MDAAGPVYVDAPQIAEAAKLRKVQALLGLGVGLTVVGVVGLYVSASGAVVADVRQFCVRQPDACAVGSQALVEFGHKAQAGAKMLYEFLNERLGSNESKSVRTTDSVPFPQPRPDM